MFRRWLNNRKSGNSHSILCEIFCRPEDEGWRAWTRLTESVSISFVFQVHRCSLLSCPIVSISLLCCQMVSRLHVKHDLFLLATDLLVEWLCLNQDWVILTDTFVFAALQSFTAPQISSRGLWKPPTGKWKSAPVNCDLIIEMLCFILKTWLLSLLPPLNVSFLKKYSRRSKIDIKVSFYKAMPLRTTAIVIIIVVI